MGLCSTNYTGLHNLCCACAVPVLVTASYPASPACKAYRILVGQLYRANLLIPLDSALQPGDLVSDNLTGIIVPTCRINDLVAGTVPANIPVGTVPLSNPVTQELPNMLTQLAAEVFGQAAPCTLQAGQPNKLQEQAVRFADIVVDGAVQEALNLQSIVDAIRADAQPERLAKFVVNAFGDALIERNYAAAKQRKCDLNAVLKTAIAHADFVVAAAGLQANARAARGFGKPAKSAKPVTLPIDGIEVQEQQSLADQINALINRLRDEGHDHFADRLERASMNEGLIE